MIIVAGLEKLIQKGFISIVSIVSILVVFIVATGVVVYFNNEKSGNLSSKEKENISDESKPVLHKTTEIETETIAIPKPTIQPENTKLNNDLFSRFKLLDEELANAKQSGSLLSSEHADRILNDLEKLKKDGYQISEIERLELIVYELTSYSQDQPSNPTTTPVTTATTTSPVPQACSTADPVLVADITDFSKIKKITAPGSPSSEGPKGHSFIWTEHQKVPVYAPADMVLDSGSYSKDTAESPAQYLLFFEVKNSCYFKIKFDHIDEPIDSVKQNFPAVPAVGDSRTSVVANKVEFRAGDLVAYTSGTSQAGNWDFGLYNTAQKGALADSYSMHAYSVCWVDYYSSEKQVQYRNLLEGPMLVCSF